MILDRVCVVHTVLQIVPVVADTWEQCQVSGPAWFYCCLIQNKCKKNLLLYVEEFSPENKIVGSRQYVGLHLVVYCKFEVMSFPPNLIKFHTTVYQPCFDYLV